MNEQPIPPETLDQLAGHLIACDAHLGAPSAIGDSIVFSGIGMHQGTRSRLRSFARSQDKMPAFLNNFPYVFMTNPDRAWTSLGMLNYFKCPLLPWPFLVLEVVCTCKLSVSRL